MTKKNLTYADFIHAAKIGDLNTIQSYQEQGADIHAHHDNAFRWSAENGHLPIVQFLLQHGADIHAENDAAFCWSTVKGHLPIVKLLLKNGADIQAGIAASIHAGIAVSSNQPKVLAWLLSYQHALEEKKRITNHLITPERDSSPATEIIKPTLPSKIRL